MLDFQTLLTLNFIVNVINFFAMALLWKRYGDRYAGVSFWTQAMAVHVIGIGLILLRGSLPLLISSVLANAFLMSSTLLMLVGFQRFTGNVSGQAHNYIAFGIYVLLLYYFSAYQPRIEYRNICGAAFIVFIDVQTCRLLFWKVSARMRQIAFYAGVVMACYVAASMLRIFILLSFPQESEMFRSGLADSVTITSYIALHICMIFALFLTVVRRLMDDVSANEEKFVKAFHLAPYGMVITRHDDMRVIEANRGFCEIFGYSRDEALGRPVMELAGVSDVQGMPPGVQGVWGMGRGEKSELRTTRRSGEPLIGEVVSEDVFINGEQFVLSTINDITEESRLKRQLEELATRDSLTGLPNRRSFYERFTLAQLHATRHRTGLAVMSIDLDRFKSVNDSLGHAAGDAVLIEAAGRLSGSLRKVDLVARFGGDEFVILLPEVTGAQDAVAVANKIITRFREPFAVQGQRVTLTASLGIALYPDHGQGLEELLGASDAALYTAKQSGRDGYVVAQPPPGP